MSDSPILTIGIPTYNGGSRIHETLESVINQIGVELIAKVNIFISDNGSTDNTQSVIRSYQASSRVHIEYSKNDSNLGFDANVDILFKKATGHFVWILADDDALEDGAVLNVVQLLERHPELKAIQVNFNSYDPRLENIVFQVSIPSDLLCHTAKEFFLNAKGRYGQVSTMIFSRDAWNSINLSDGLGSNYIHIYGLLRILLLGESYILKQPLVKARMGSENFGTSGDSLIRTPLGAGRLFTLMPQMGHEKHICKLLLNENRRYVFGTIKEARKRGIDDKLGIIRELIAVHNSFRLWTKWIPVILLSDSTAKRHS